MKSDELLGRGVYRSPWTVRGQPVFIAVDSKGECVATVDAAGDLAALLDEESLAIAWLEGVLEHCDPLPRLELLV